MRLFTATLVLFTAIQANAQCDGNRFFNQVFNDYEEEENIPYGMNTNLDGEEETLLMDVYTPVGDTSTDRPLIIMVHGGSFIGGSKDGQDIHPLAADFSKMGFVVASINYRLGIPFAFPVAPPAQEAVLRGVQDARAAVRWFRKDVAENGNTYDIDDSEIYMMGSSAGGFVSLHVAYMDQDDELPPLVDLSNPGLSGGTEGESGNPGYSSTVKAIVNIAGAIGEWEWMTDNDTPVLSLHGTGDTVVPFDTDVLELFGAIDVMEVDGSSTVHQMADSLGIVNCFEVYEMQGHVPHVNNAAYYDTTRSITSNFLGSMVCPEVPLDCEYREITLSQEEELALLDMDIYPNPARGILTIELPASAEGTLRLIDAQGKTVWKERIQRPISQLDTRDFAEGMYVLEWNSGETLLTEQVIVRH